MAKINIEMSINQGAPTGHVSAGSQPSDRQRIEQVAQTEELIHLERSTQTDEIRIRGPNVQVNVDDLKSYIKRQRKAVACETFLQGMPAHLVKLFIA